MSVAHATICPLPIPIKIEEDTKETIIKEEIIDLDDYTSSEERIRRWNSKVRRKIILLYDEDEACKVLFSLMKWYSETLLEDIIDSDICDTFIHYLNNHLNFYYHTFVKSKFHSMDQYLSHMEDILAINLDYEVELFVKDRKRYKKTYHKKMLRKLQTLLFYDTDSYLNVLLKVKLDLGSEASKMDYWNSIFRFILSKKPKSTTDLDFCRAYIIHQRLKKINNQNSHNIIDDMLFTAYSRGPKDIASNKPLQEISRPPTDSVLDFIAQVNNDRHLCKAFIEYVIRKNEEDTMRAVKERLEEDDSDDEQLQELRKVYPMMLQMDTSQQRSLLQAIEALQAPQPESTPSSSRSPHETEQQPNSQSISSTTNQDQTENVNDVKLEDDNECIIIGEGTMDCSPLDTQIVHEIVDDDDDDDISSIIYFTKKPPRELGFLESINIPEAGSNKENRNPKDKPKIRQNAVASPTFKLQSRNSVQSREKQSRKVTRKKSINTSIEEMIDLDDVASIEHPSIDIIDDDEVTDTSEEPSDTISETSANSSEHQVPKPSSESELPIPHSTHSNNSDVCNVSTSEQNKVQYTSPTSPDISSTYEPNEIDLESVVEGSIVTEKYLDQEASAEGNIPLSNHIDHKASAEGSIAVVNDLNQETSSEESVAVANNANRAPRVEVSSAQKDSTKKSVESAINISPIRTAQDMLISADSTKDAASSTDFFPGFAVNRSAKTADTNVLREEIAGKAKQSVDNVTLRRKNGHIEHNNNDVVKDTTMNVFNKELNVRLTKLNLEQEKPGNKILFTSKSKLNKQEDDIHLKFRALTADQDLFEDYMSGAVSKISCSSSTVTNFDIFEDSPPPSLNTGKSNHSTVVPSHPDVNSASSDVEKSPQSIESPEFDEIRDDFTTYLDSYKKGKSPVPSVPARKTKEKLEEGSYREEKSPVPSVPARKTKEKLEEEVPAKRRKICFADERGFGTVAVTNKHVPVPKSSKHQSILKKPKKILIPQEEMNLQSLIRYGVEPTDPLLQGIPYVDLEMLSEREINVKQKKKKGRRRKQQTEQTEQNEDNDGSSEKFVKVVYDKSTPSMCKGDIVLCASQGFVLLSGPWPEYVKKDELASDKERNDNGTEPENAGEDDGAGPSTGPPDPPPGRPCAIASSDSVTLTWNRCAYDGGKMITGYAVDCTSVGNNRWTTIVEECQSHSYVVTGLQPGGHYVFRVRALNAHGYSKPSNVSEFVRLEELELPESPAVQRRGKGKSTMAYDNRRQNGKRKLEIGNDYGAGSSSSSTLGPPRGKQPAKRGRPKRKT